MGLYRKNIILDTQITKNEYPESKFFSIDPQSTKIYDIYIKKVSEKHFFRYRPKWRCHRIPSAHKAECNTVAAPFFIICYSYPATKVRPILL